MINLPDPDYQITDSFRVCLPLFKYMRSEHAIKMVTDGILRIGTLYEYRDIEQHDDRVGDRWEGVSSAYQRIDHLVASSNRDLPEFLAGIVEVGIGRPAAEVGGAVFHDCIFVRTDESPDFYIFSLSNKFDPVEMLRFGYDACVRIDNPPSFFRVLSAAFAGTGEFQGAFPCIYEARQKPHDEPHLVHPALLKDPEYSSQYELRAIWAPASGQAPKPEIVTCTKIRRYCTRIV